MTDTVKCDVTGVYNGKYYSQSIPKEDLEQLMLSPMMMSAVDAIGYPPGKSGYVGAPHIKEVLKKIRDAGWPAPSPRWYMWKTRLWLSIFLIFPPVIGWLLIWRCWNEYSPLEVKHPKVEKLNIQINPNLQGYVTNWNVSIG